ncbi:hypothetical protein CLU79DRAFT_749969 [Phycomyces nitens]|nr:hypothetical protein CLU79DRAFT_749969 [Phycomyces nitens]
MKFTLLSLMLFAVLGRVNAAPVDPSESGLLPIAVLTAPSPNTVWQIGSNQFVSWGFSADGISRFTISLTKQDSNSTFSQILAPNVDASTGYTLVFIPLDMPVNSDYTLNIIRDFVVLSTVENIIITEKAS